MLACAAATIPAVLAGHPVGHHFASAGAGHFLASRLTWACVTGQSHRHEMKDLKAELDDLGVAWRGVCFEKRILSEHLKTLAQIHPACSCSCSSGG